MRALGPAAVGLGLGLGLGCGDQSTFAVGRDLQICDSNLPTACGLAARCVLDDTHYLQGRFPSARRFIVRTAGEATIRFQLLLTDEHTPGTELQFIVHEPGCGDRQTWDSAGQDPFRLTGGDGVLSVPVHVTQPGDHLVEFVSDAYCAYALKLNL